MNLCLGIVYTCIDDIKISVGHQIVISYEFITEPMLSSICQFLRLLKMSVARISLLLRPVSYIFLTSMKFSFKYLT